MSKNPNLLRVKYPIVPRNCVKRRESGAVTLCYFCFCPRVPNLRPLATHLSFKQMELSGHTATANLVSHFIFGDESALREDVPHAPLAIVHRQHALRRLMGYVARGDGFRRPDGSAHRRSEKSGSFIRMATCALRSAISGGRNEEEIGSNEPSHTSQRCGFLGRLIMLAKIRYAPATPSGSCR
jgi:hypothetical protein